VHGEQPLQQEDLQEEAQAQQQQQDEGEPDLAVAPILGPLLQPGKVLEITNETPAGARGELYASQAALFVTTRILVVDFLSRRLLPSQVSVCVHASSHAYSCVHIACIVHATHAQLESMCAGAVTMLPLNQPLNCRG
jgi:hypothetical protein